MTVSGEKSHEDIAKRRPDHMEQNHPVTDMPALFVHPCNTASALQEATPSQELTPLQYLQLWLGIIGGCVGLQMPVALASQIDIPSP
ncbi:uncharacterized protein K452DRAFT_287761 [Aplosporella prunicola CBS 121167]|uniref:Uncharacterized protein n=1 Tax=Aplosporella prunicola CBS 121167 TaxID=1176127 RepID=A0A6A6BGX5_9PEZI|nr:uncharacterized protein K452DRAFT_287761 [Aplosporella prunicola CBS 121167]KAF2141801.1 hypothetical protein K452DRAFT_287761 [Aplosporella prunicola CBS 121167]